jgi:RimJ/RimL family protein N-acetyltransferase
MGSRVIVRTPRLVLRRWRDADIAPLAAINADAEVMRWIADGSTRAEAQTRASVAAFERGWDERGFGICAVEIGASGELAGLTGLAIPSFLPQVMPAVEIAWRLGRPYWGQGLATEAAQGVLGLAFTQCGLDTIVAIVQAGNAASERIMIKLGMRLERETTDHRTGRPVLVYEITRDEYLAAHSG